MQDLINNLDDATAVRVLQAFATARSRHGDYQTQWSLEMRQGLEERLEEPQLPDEVIDGDLAREALLLLANEPENQEPLNALIRNSSPEKFLDAGAVAIGVAALIALQTHLKFEKTKDGKIHFKLEKKPLPVDLIKKLICFFSQNPSGKA